MAAVAAVALPAALGVVGVASGDTAAGLGTADFSSPWLLREREEGEPVIAGPATEPAPAMRRRDDDDEAWMGLEWMAREGEAIGDREGAMSAESTYKRG